MSYPLQRTTAGQHSQHAGYSGVVKTELETGKVERRSCDRARKERRRAEVSVDDRRARCGYKLTQNLLPFHLL